MMLDVKEQISEWISVDKNCLNDISLEDVEVSDYALQNIDAATKELLLQAVDEEMFEPPGADPLDRLPCKSYWVEETKELVLFYWNAWQAKTIVIPSEGWMLKPHITVH